VRWPRQLWRREHDRPRASDAALEEATDALERAKDGRAEVERVTERSREQSHQNHWVELIEDLFTAGRKHG
jgi:hypothetical protein